MSNDELLQRKKHILYIVTIVLNQERQVINMSNKSERLNMAKEHTKLMTDKYFDQISSSVQNTEIYDNKVPLPSNLTIRSLNDCEPIRVVPYDTVSALFKYGSGTTTVLNFASFRHPGGGYISGAVAQEEALCTESFLYNVLVKFQNSFYAENNSFRCNSMYKNRALYSPKILFQKEQQQFSCDVLTCAAPNRSGTNVSAEENTRVLDSRIKFVLDIALAHDPDVLILGAFGCGVFGQDPAQVASVFKKYLTATDLSYHFKKVIFAIPDSRNSTFSVFKSIFD